LVQLAYAGTGWALKLRGLHSSTLPCTGRVLLLHARALDRILTPITASFLVGRRNILHNKAEAVKDAADMHAPKRL
jgi:hypothetical protein